MTREVKQLLQQFLNRYDDISKINLLDYEQFVIELVERGISKDTVNTLRNILNLYKKEQGNKEISFSKFINLILEQNDKFTGYSNNVRKNKRRRYSSSLLSESGDILPLLEFYEVKRDADFDLELMFLNQRLKQYDKPGKDAYQLAKKYISD